MTGFFLVWEASQGGAKLKLQDEGRAPIEDGRRRRRPLSKLTKTCCCTHWLCQLHMLSTRFSSCQLHWHTLIFLVPAVQPFFSTSSRERTGTCSVPVKRSGARRRHAVPMKCSRERRSQLCLKNPIRPSGHPQLVSRALLFHLVSIPS